VQYAPLVGVICAPVLSKNWISPSFTQFFEADRTSVNLIE